MSIIGLLNSTFLQVDPMGRMHIRRLQWQLLRNWSHGQSYNKLISVTPSLSKHLKWWNPGRLSIGAQPYTLPDLRFRSLPMPPRRDGVPTAKENKSKAHGPRTTWTSTLTCLTWRSFWWPWNERFAPILKRKVVMFLCDNSAMVWHLKKGGGVKVWQLYALSGLILTKACSLKIVFQIRHIPGALNVIADRLSRSGEVLQTEWNLHPKVFEAIGNNLYRRMIDAFDTSENTKLPLYMSPILDQGAYAIDALSTPWVGLCLYIFPPTNILSEVLRKLAAEPCRALVLAPFWPAQVLLWDLVYACTDRPRSLPWRENLLRQPGKGPPVHDTSYNGEICMFGSLTLQSRWVLIFNIRCGSPHFSSVVT